MEEQLAELGYSLAVEEGWVAENNAIDPESRKEIGRMVCVSALTQTIYILSDYRPLLTVSASQPPLLTKELVDLFLDWILSDEVQSSHSQLDTVRKQIQSFPDRALVHIMLCVAYDPNYTVPEDICDLDRLLNHKPAIVISNKDEQKFLFEIRQQFRLEPQELADLLSI